MVEFYFSFKIKNIITLKKVLNTKVRSTYVKNGKGKKEGKCRKESNRQKQRCNKQSKYRNQNITDKLCNKAKTIEVKKTTSIKANT